MKIKTLLLVPLIAIAIAYIGVKGYIYYKTKEGLDKIITLASPYVQIDYTDVGSELTGSVSIEHIRITPTGTYDEVTIQKLTLSGDGLGFLLDIAKGFKGNEIPAHMNISFKQLEAPVSSSFISKITSSFSPDDHKKEIDTCSIPGILSAAGLKDLGLTSISLDGNIGYIYDKEASQAEYSLRYNLAGVESSLFELRLSQLSVQGMMGLGKLPVVEEVRMIRQFEPDYMSKAVEYCAKQTSLPPNEFIDDLFTQSDDYYLKTLGFIPGLGLSDLFRQLITDAGTVEIRAAPSSEISPALLKAYRPEDLVILFGVTASYNGTPITDLSFSMQSSAPKTTEKSPESIAGSATPTPIQSAPVISKPAPKLRYLDTNIASLKNYINYKVRAYTINNAIPKEGILDSITNNTLNIEHLLFSGKMTSHLNIDRIERIEVLRKEEPEDN